MTGVIIENMRLFHDKERNCKTNNRKNIYYTFIPINSMFNFS